MKILIHCIVPGHIGILAPLIKKLEENGHILLYTKWQNIEWVTGEKEGWSPVFSDPILPNEADCTIVLNPPSLWPDLAFPEPIIYIPHGSQIVSPGKVIGLPNACAVDPRANLSLIQGEIHYEQCKKYNFQTKYIMTGWPKVDELVNVDHKQIKKNVIDELNLNPHKPILVYAPTSEVPKYYIDGQNKEKEENNSTDIIYPYPNSIGHLASYVYEQLKNDYNIIFCPHELDYWKKHMDGLPNVIYPKAENKNRYLIASDLLIGDRSSIMHEYLATKKPMIHLWNDLDIDNFSLHLYGDPNNEEVAFGPKISAREIKKYVDMLIGNPNLYLELREKWLNKIFYSPGTATERAIKAIEEYVSEWKSK